LLQRRVCKLPVPFGQSSLQFVRRNFAEATLFQIACEWERAAGTDKKHPPIGPQNGPPRG
jgi:Asp-tRNA(Asn)/Glu-tRNA(Gln) amidotransferase A subunit family amidase